MTSGLSCSTPRPGEVADAADSADADLGIRPAYYVSTGRGRFRPVACAVLAHVHARHGTSPREVRELQREVSQSDQISAPCRCITLRKTDGSGAQVVRSE